MFPPRFSRRTNHRSSLRWLAGLAVEVVFVLLPAPVRAGGGAATDSYDDVGAASLDVHAMADLYVQHRLGVRGAGALALRSFDSRTDEPSVAMVRLTMARKPDLFGFRLDVGAGEIPDGYLRFDPAAAAHPRLSRALSYVEQAFVSARVPVGRGLVLDVGKFGTPVGLEDNEALANWSYSRSLLYMLAEPSYHAGLRVTYPLTDTLAVSLFWVNGWDANVLDGNGMRAFAAATSWSPNAKLEIVADYMGGPERAPTHLADPTLGFRNELDAYARYELTPRIAFACTADYGHDAASGGVSWWGVGGYARVTLLDWLAAALRAEHYADDDGFTSGTRQRLAELTGTLEVRAATGVVKWVGRLEYRRDQSDARLFTGGQGASTLQDTVGASMVAAF